ncbi:MAG: hypothetical protein F6J95_027750 [Leptolyngbya sp. SIO1E4]|nr:hypothetical protein [Leptolyngbya sp. SIO1E4]
MSEFSYSRAKVPTSTSDFNPAHQLPGQRPFALQQKPSVPQRPATQEEIVRMKRLDAAVMRTPPLQAKQAIGAYKQEVSSPQVSSVTPHSLQGNPLIQRTIGAELEVVAGGLLYEPQQFQLNQGDVIGYVQHNSGSGKTTEIHAEQPNNKEGTVTLEYATGKYTDIAAENLSHLAQDVQELNQITGQIQNNQNLNNWFTKGFQPHLQATSANVQINVSPFQQSSLNLVKHTAQGATLKPSEDGSTRTQHENTIPDTEGHRIITTQLNNILRNMIRSTYTSLNPDNYGTFVDAILPPLVMHITGLISLSYRNMVGTIGSTQRNTFQVLPRYDLMQLINPKATQLAATDNHVSRQNINALVHGSMAIVEDTIKLAVIQSINNNKQAQTDIEDFQLDENTVAADVSRETTTNMQNILSGQALLVASRLPGGQQAQEPPAILPRTTTTKIPIGPESPEGGYEIRQPFAENVPIAEWSEAMRAYERSLLHSGVRYLNGH